MNLPGGEGGIVDKVEQLLWISNGYQALHCQVEAQGLILRRFIHYKNTGRQAQVHNNPSSEGCYCIHHGKSHIHFFGI